MLRFMSPQDFAQIAPKFISARYRCVPQFEEERFWRLDDALGDDCWTLFFFEWTSVF